jgi:signal transduction histidine kinase/ActR/RegA family two-component response regulator
VPSVGGLIVNARDITEELALAEQLQQARKMEAIGQLAGGIAHDFNNILAAILGFADFLLHDLPDNSPQHMFAQRIASAGRRGRDLVEQILAFARKSAMERAPTDLVPIVHELRDLLRASLPSSTQLTIVAPAEALVAEVNPGQISRVVLNLCVNASQALHGKPGQVAVAITRVEPGSDDFDRFDPESGSSDEGTVVVGGLDPGHCYARITVADDGSGIEPTVLRRIFEPFFTTKRRNRGTGLGLAVVHGIVAEYGGACVVESRPGHGTIFKIYLPLVGGAPSEIAISEGAPSAAGHERLLVVDDEPMLTEMLKLGLERLGYLVTAVNDPGKAFALFEREPEAFDAVISDHIMPKMTGLALLARFKAIRPRLPFVLCSGYGDGTTENSALDAGADAFFVKPAPTERLAQKIRELIETASANELDI